MTAADRDWLRADLEAAWRAVQAVPGPGLGDAAPLAERNRVFGERLQRFQAVMVTHEEPPPPPDEPDGGHAFDDLL